MGAYSFGYEQGVVKRSAMLLEDCDHRDVSLDPATRLVLLSYLWILQFIRGFLCLLLSPNLSDSADPLSHEICAIFRGWCCAVGMSTTTLSRYKSSIRFKAGLFLFLTYFSNRQPVSLLKVGFTAGEHFISGARQI